MERKEFTQWHDAPAEPAIVQVDNERHCQTTDRFGKIAAVGSRLENRDEDLTLIDLFLMPTAIATCLLGMGAGVSICFLVW